MQQSHSDRKDAAGGNSEYNKTAAIDSLIQVKAQIAFSPYCLPSSARDRHGGAVHD